LTAHILPLFEDGAKVPDDYLGGAMSDHPAF